MVLTPIDWAVLGLAAVFGIAGLFRGFVREVFNIASHIVAIVATFRFYPQVYSFITPAVPKGYEAAGKLASALIIYLAVMTVFFVLEKMVRAVVKTLKLGFADRILGLAFGAAKGFLIATVLFILIVTFFPKAEEGMKNAATYPFLKRASRIVVNLSPSRFKNRFNSRSFPELLNRIKEGGE